MKVKPETRSPREGAGRDDDAPPSVGRSRVSRPLTRGRASFEAVAGRSSEEKETQKSMGVTLGGVPLGKPRRRGSVIASVTPEAGPAPELRADAWRASGNNVPAVKQYATAESAPERDSTGAVAPNSGNAGQRGERVDDVRVQHRYDVTRQSVRNEQRAFEAKKVLYDMGPRPTAWAR